MELQSVENSRTKSWRLELRTACKSTVVSPGGGELSEAIEAHPVCRNARARQKQKRCIGRSISGAPENGKKEFEFGVSGLEFPGWRSGDRKLKRPGVLVITHNFLQLIR